MKRCAAFGLFACLLLPLHADDAFQKTDQGIDLTIGDAQVELAAATPTALRLSVSYDGKAAPLATTFLLPDVKPGATPWEVVHQAALVGVKSAAGELLIDPQSGQWTLLNAQGATVIPATPLGKCTAVDPVPPMIDMPHVDPTTHQWTNVRVPDTAQKPETARIDFVLPAAAPKLYGSGNGADSLVQKEAKSRTANGVAVTPYYWSTAGYALLGVSGWDNRPAQWTLANDGNSIAWTFSGKKADLYLMPVASLRDAATAFGQLSGTAPVPPRWSFGYLQSRWGWKDRAYIEDTLHQFRTRNLPVDAFIYDFEWYTPEADYELPPEGKPGFSDFGWNHVTFPAPTAQVAAYRADGLHFIAIRKPRMGNPDNLTLMRAKGWDLHPHLQVSSPASRTGDFANPDFRAWYAAQSQPLLQKDVYGWWNDEGDGSFGSYTTYYYWNQAELDAFAQAKPERRYWSLNRAFSPGTQRLGAAAWTGDIQARWDVLAGTCTNLLNWSLAGMPYVTCDIGGYSPETSPELLTRWMEAGVFFPVMRAHSEIGRTPHFPWLFGNDALHAIGNALNLRYRLIPYIYSLAYESHETGVPLMRPIAMEYPGDADAANLSDEWLLGPGLLAAPIIADSNKRSVYLPKDTWYRFETATPIQGPQKIDVTAKLDEIPAYVRAGTILPLGPVVQDTDQLPGGPLTLEIYPGKDATFTLAEDDGETTAYLKGAYRKTTFHWDDAKRTLSWTTEGSYDGPHLFREVTATVYDSSSNQSVKAWIAPQGSVTIPHN